MTAHHPLNPRGKDIVVLLWIVGPVGLIVTLAVVPRYFLIPHDMYCLTIHLDEKYLAS